MVEQGNHKKQNAELNWGSLRAFQRPVQPAPSSSRPQNTVAAAADSARQYRLLAFIPNNLVYPQLLCNCIRFLMPELEGRSPVDRGGHPLKLWSSLYGRWRSSPGAQALRGGRQGPCVQGRGPWNRLLPAATSKDQRLLSPDARVTRLPVVSCPWFTEGARWLLGPPSEVQCKRDIMYRQRLFGVFLLLFFSFCSTRPVCMGCRALP